MDCKKYIGMDVHQATISIAVMDEAGKVVMDSVIETKARTILEFIQGLRGTLWVTFEEGTSAAWLYDLLKPYVAKVVVCDPRKNALLKAGNKNDRIDARKLADLLRVGLLSPVYHGESGVGTLKELARSYLDDHQRSDAGEESHQRAVPELGDPLCGAKSIFPAAPYGLAEATARKRSAAPRGTLISATR